MATTVKRDRTINYLTKDFGSFRDRLIEFAKNYFPDTYNDFSGTSPGMMFIEMASYVGDILSFYTDTQVQETFLQYAKNPSNLYTMAYMMGYRPKITTVSEADLTVTQIVPAVSSSFEPDWDEACRIKEFSSVQSITSPPVNFLFRDPVDFNYSSSVDKTVTYVTSWDDNGDPAEYALVKKAKIFSGEIKTTTRVIGNYKKFLTLTLKDPKLVGILDIVDSDGNVWQEVPFLGQDTVFEDDEPEIGSVEAGTPSLLKLKKVQRRFITRFTSKGEMKIQFGAGMYATDADNENFYPNPLSLEPDIQDISKSTRYDQAYDPSNFLFSNSYGLAPANTTLTIRYIVGGGVESNVPARTIVKENGVIITNSSTGGESSLKGSDLIYENEFAAAGGRNGDTLEEIRQNSLRAYAEQKRVVTLNDFNVRSLSLPEKFGVVSKVYAAKEPLSEVRNSDLTRNPLAITLYVLSENVQGKLDYANDILKQNLRTYLSEYMMVTDSVDIKDAFIINLGIKYDIVIKPGYQSSDVLLACTEEIKDFFKTGDRTINEAINLSHLYTRLDNVRGVQTVKKIYLENKVGEGYSGFGYDVNAAVRNNVLYPSYDPCIFEVRYPEQDIEGRVTTL